MERDITEMETTEMGAKIIPSGQLAVMKAVKELLQREYYYHIQSEEPSEQYRIRFRIHEAICKTCFTHKSYMTVTAMWLLHANSKTYVGFFCQKFRGDLIEAIRNVDLETIRKSVAKAQDYFLSGIVKSEELTSQKAREIFTVEYYTMYNSLLQGADTMIPEIQDYLGDRYQRTFRYVCLGMGSHSIEQIPNIVKIASGDSPRKFYFSSFYDMLRNPPPSLKERYASEIKILGLGL